MENEKRRRSRDGGFTLVEIVVAIVLVGILSAVVVIGVGRLTTQGTAAACEASADAARAADTAHRAATGIQPTTFTDMITSGALTAPDGATVDPNSLAGNGWTLQLTAGTGSNPATFTCLTSTLPVAGAVRWLDASDAGTVIRSGPAVTSWIDKGRLAQPLGPAGSGADVTWSADGLATGEPAIVTNAGKVLTSAPNPTNTTVFAVARTIGPTRGRVIGATNNWLLGWFSGGEDRAYFESWVSATGVAATDQTRLYSATQTPTNATVWRNGTQIATTTGSFQGPRGLTIGGYGGDFTQTSNAAISEVIVYDRILTDPERQQVEQYLKTKWGIP